MVSDGGEVSKNNVTCAMQRDPELPTEAESLGKHEYISDRLCDSVLSQRRSIRTHEPWNIVSMANTIVQPVGYSDTR